MYFRLKGSLSISDPITITNSIQTIMTLSELVTIETTFYSRVLTNDLDLSKNITPLFPTKEHLKKYMSKIFCWIYFPFLLLMIFGFRKSCLSLVSSLFQIVTNMTIGSQLSESLWILESGPLLHHPIHHLCQPCW